MQWGKRSWLGVLLGCAFGTAYGVLVRGMAEWGLVFDVMSVTFLFVTPLFIGFLSVLPLRSPGIGAAVGLPLASSTMTLIVANEFGWEGLICIAMALLPLFLLALIGGLIAWGIKLVRINREERERRLHGLALLPLLFAILEARIGAPLEERVVATRIEIQATPAEVWEQIVEVPPIQAHEHRRALFTAIGFPRPVAALVDRRELGGVRRATFEGGVFFLERITRFEPERALEFTIDAQEELIPPTTLDPHVTIGGPYFDVLRGCYEIEARDGGVVLHLHSELRVSTRFNFYAGPWADLVMASIQRNILQIVKARAEKG